MSRNKQGSKTGRRERHLARQAALREAKALRRKRAARHAAMREAARMQRSKKKGTRDFVANMRTLGYVSAKPDVEVDGRYLIGDVLAKYEAIS